MGRKKEIYLDENGNPCKYWQTPEFKAKAKAKRQTPEYKAKLKAWRDTPVQKAKSKARNKAKWQTPEYKAKEKARRQTSEWKAKQKAHRETPEAKAKQKAHREKPEAKAKDRARSQTPEWKARHKAWCKTPEGKAKCRKYSAKKKAKRLKRDILLDKAGRKAIAEIYANCPDDWHVDHIAPLLGKTISGLHHPDNLQYLPAWVNCMKGNRWDDSWASHTMDTPSLEEKIKAYSLVQV